MADEVARYRPSDRLLGLVERAGLAAGRIAAAPPEVTRTAAEEAAREQAQLSAMLDGSPLDPATVQRVDTEGIDPSPTASPELADHSGAGDDMRAVGGSNGWAAALRVDGLPTQDVAAREYANLVACAELEAHVAESFFEQPLHALTMLHAAICAGLVAPDAVARLRRTERAIHDGAQGAMLWAAPQPDHLPALIDGLLEWLGAHSATKPTLVVAAVAHEKILEWQPFEAANGRLARSVARVIRRARGLDPFSLSVPERYWWQHTMDYHREVAKTIRRRGDLTRWIEKMAHAETLALEAAADHVVPISVVQPSRPLVEFVHALAPGATLTVKDVADRLGISREQAHAELAHARRAGMVTEDVTVPVPRFVVRAPQ